jgi:chromosome segregation protein
MTRVTRLHLRGFKSFANPLDLDFTSGYNVVIGPNGSGKSNIMDALCFVLGKLSAKSMRAEKSANLIFNGGKKGSAMKEAEVSIFFDNGQQQFPHQGAAPPPSEVKITRIIRHNGNSVYKINDEVRTRQQVLELLAAARIDPDGHNIILQGDIVSFMEMHPEERRQLIEEISGISIYEDRKQKAMGELTKVDGKLNEATIILNEREAYLRELKKDRDHALKYQELERNIKSNKATYLHLQISDKQKKIDVVDAKMQKQQEQMDKLKGTIQKLREEIQKNKGVIEQITKDIEQKSEKESVALQKEIETVRTALLKQLLVSVQDVDTTISRLEKSAEEAQQKLKDLQQREKKLEGEIQETRKKHPGGVSAEVAEVEEQLVAHEKELGALQDDLQETLQTKFSVDAKIASVQERLKQYQHLEKELHLDKTAADFKKTEEHLGKAFIEESSCLTQLKELQRQIQEKEGAVFRLQARESGLRESLSVDKAVETILSLKTDAKWSKKIFGTVSQLGHVDEQYSLALEVAAGARMKSIVVDSDETAAHCINLLKEKKSGIATFLPLNKIQSKAVKPTTSGKGIRGAALDLISYDKQFKDVFSFVFGGTLVVDDIAVARRIGIGKARMVTLEGDMMETSGAMIGGHRVRQIGLHFQEKKATGELKETQEELTALRKKKDLLETRKTELEERTATLRRQKSELEGVLVKAKSGLEGVDLDALRKEEKELANHAVYKEHVQLQKRLDDVQKKVQDLKDKRDKARKQTTGQAPTILEKLEQQRLKIREEVVQLHTEAKNIQSQIENIYLPEKEKTKQILKQQEKELQEFVKEEQHLSEQIKKQSSLLQEMEKKEDKFKQDYKDLFHKRNKLSEEIQKGENKILDEERGQEDIQGRLHEISIERAKALAEREALDREYEEFKGVALREHISFEKLKEEIKKFESMLKDIGSVNMRALEVYDDIKKEYDGLLDKVAGLQKEKDDVLQMMYEIDSKKKDTFMVTFNVLAKNFTTIFSQLSTKGEASLLLENKEEPLQGGVDILVRLVGNKFLDIKSLSGGEKTLAALAFIFAIQEHQPAAFYLLDEVDAALDKTNSDLLSKYIAKYSQKAQYILISHNDMMISEAEAIYGVSMQENGISKVVSLKV